MNKKEVLRIALPVPFRRYFDYLPIPGVHGLKSGMRVRVPFQRRELIGIFIEKADDTVIEIHKLKPILEVLDEEPILPDTILKLCLWGAEYYHYPAGEVLLGALPAKLRQGKSPLIKKKKNIFITEKTIEPLTLNQKQQEAVDKILETQNQFNVFLLEGVTGSGKTEVYSQVIAEFIKKDQQALLLVPEIGLTPQTIQQFRDRFAVPIVTFHSAMTEKERLESWLAAKSGEAKIIIGTRSGIFAPLPNLGLIVIDEEHDLSFKQQEGFRYHARDLSIMRAYFENIPIVLGSATPSLETLYNAKQGRYHWLKLPERVGKASLPEFQILDIRNLSLEQGLSQPLLNEMEHHLRQGNQVMLFLNRRGYAPVLMCHSCGWIAMCPRCDARLTYHYGIASLHCHHCDTQKKMLRQCESCHSKEFVPIGQGTERLETTLKDYFSKYSLVRIDRDTTRKKGSMENLLDQITQGEHQILIGTQMLAKGHHFPNVTLVAIVDADAGFFSSDFRSLERMGQLLLQVSGRAGREEKAGKVIIQTYHPDHPLLHQLINNPYAFFAETLLEERIQAKLPPSVFFALFRAEAHQVNQATDFLHAVKKMFMENKKIQLLGPIPAPMARKSGRFRMQLLLQAEQRVLLQNMLKSTVPNIEKLRQRQQVRWSLDIDPLEMF